MQLQINQNETTNETTNQPKCNYKSTKMQLQINQNATTNQPKCNYKSTKMQPKDTAAQLKICANNSNDSNRTLGKR